jgi:hypothetical protein
MDVDHHLGVLDAAELADGEVQPRRRLLQRQPGLLPHLPQPARQHPPPDDGPLVLRHVTPRADPMTDHGTREPRDRESRTPGSPPTRPRDRLALRRRSRGARSCPRRPDADAARVPTATDPHRSARLLAEAAVIITRWPRVAHRLRSAHVPDGDGRCTGCAGPVRAAPTWPCALAVVSGGTAGTSGAP